MATSAVRPAGRKRRRVAVSSADEYEEISGLGVGAFGAVVKARHRATGETAAIKRLPYGDAAALLREASFHEDACASGGGNPFVVGFRGVIRDHDQDPDLSLVMECVVGPNLHDVLQQHRGARLPEATVLAAMWQLLTGASKIHASRIVHRDIKPQNILVGGEGHSVLKICDFGLAMSMSEPPPYEPVGTLWYQAPELLLEKEDYDTQVDVWALGCVMAEMINTGRPLFQGFHDDGQLCAIFDALGVPDNWPWFVTTPFNTVVVEELDMPRSSSLRELFPETKLSSEGFQVLSGLLTCDPDKRLTAAAALKLPWFSKIDVLKLPNNEEVPSLLTKRRRMHHVMCA